MEIRLGDDALTEAVAGVRRALDGVDATRRRAADRVELLLDGGWSGSAASSFADAWQDWLGGAAVVSRGLVDVGVALATIDRDLRGTDLTAADRASTLAERLG